jgi:hypothetical protein
LTYTDEPNKESDLPKPEAYNVVEIGFNGSIASVEIFKVADDKT